MDCLIRGLLVLLLSGMWGTAYAAAIHDSDIVVVDGRYWTQPDLFTGLTWAEINTVCRGGVCGTGSLNGHDMAGWVLGWRRTLEPVVQSLHRIRRHGTGTGYIFGQRQHAAG